MGATLKDASGPFGRRDVVVSKVEAGSAAEAQGVKVGDRVCAVNGGSVAGRNKDEVKGMIRVASRPLTLELQQVQAL